VLFEVVWPPICIHLLIYPVLRPFLQLFLGEGKFGYVNLHYDFIGSYTASGSGKGGRGTLECVEAAAALDMGVFIISPYDKGGKLYKPPAKFTRLCEEENGLTPIEFNT